MSMYGPTPKFEREDYDALEQTKDFFNRREGTARAKPFVAKCLGADWNVPRIEYAFARLRLSMRRAHRDPESKL